MRSATARRFRAGAQGRASARFANRGSTRSHHSREKDNANYHPDMHARHRERHRIGRTGWLRAAVLGANDGILSTASLVVGVAAAGAGRQAILLAGIAGLVAGSLSMAAGEYVSVS